MFHNISRGLLVYAWPDNSQKRFEIVQKYLNDRLDRIPSVNLIIGDNWAVFAGRTKTAQDPLAAGDKWGFRLAKTLSLAPQNPPPVYATTNAIFCMGDVCDSYVAQHSRARLTIPERNIEGYFDRVRTLYLEKLERQHGRRFSAPSPIEPFTVLADLTQQSSTAASLIRI